MQIKWQLAEKKVFFVSYNNPAEIVSFSRTHIELFCGKGPDPDSSGVSLWHSVHVTDVCGWDAEAGAHASHRAVGRRHKRVRPYREDKPPFEPDISHSSHTFEQFKST